MNKLNITLSVLSRIKFRFPFLTRLLEIKEQQLEIEQEKLTYLNLINKKLSRIEARLIINSEKLSIINYNIIVNKQTKSKKQNGKPKK